MVEIILEFLICLYQVVIFQLLAYPFFRKVTYRLALARNSEWVDNHQEKLKEFPMPKDYLQIFIAILSLLGLFLILLTEVPTDHFYLIHLFSAFGLLLYLVIDLPLYLGMVKLIPRSSMKAELKERRLKDFVLPGVLPLSILLNILSFVMTGRDLPLISHLLNVAYFVIVLWAIRYTLKRPPICENLEIDRSFRWLELNFINLIFLITPLTKLLKYHFKTEGGNASIINSFSSFMSLFLFSLFILVAKQFVFKRLNVI